MSRLAQSVQKMVDGIKTELEPEGPAQGPAETTDGEAAAGEQPQVDGDGSPDDGPQKEDGDMAIKAPKTASKKVTVKKASKKAAAPKAAAPKPKAEKKPKGERRKAERRQPQAAKVRSSKSTQLGINTKLSQQVVRDALLLALGANKLTDEQIAEARSLISRLDQRLANWKEAA